MSGNYKALILVGGYGTRLRPLTMSVPKPLVPFANQPMLLHQMEALRDAGVTEFILAVSVMPQLLEQELAAWGQRHGVKVIFSLETTPLGTAGPIALAKQHLAGDTPFYMLNSDVMCAFPLRELMAHHLAKGGEGTIMVTNVEDPSRYGVIVADASHKIESFVEKPKNFTGTPRINAGIYVLNPSVINRIEPRPTSIEREIFPRIAGEGKLFCFDLQGFWMDIGQPRDYLRGQALFLHHLGTKGSLAPACAIPATTTIGANVLIHPSATIGAKCVIGPNVVIGENCVVEDCVRLTECALFDNVRVKNGASISISIVGKDCTIGRWGHLEQMCVLAEDVQVGDDVVVVGQSVFSHKSLAQSILHPGIVM
eukprot:gnl/Hemi2/1514_TR536_c0_g1_i1.p1 gnl/Hemi2/1514_TR536_c0_g1~~gnl/Hemi2/1514_TR536_c0_g1_i1.p1  ORF type:complete len:384 (-),score=150.76 gnl/Hemi2/1514_TR536_c0_g1_i1:188-1291(-)